MDLERIVHSVAIFCDEGQVEFWLPSLLDRPGARIRFGLTRDKTGLIALDEPNVPLSDSVFWNIDGVGNTPGFRIYHNAQLVRKGTS